MKLDHIYIKNAKEHNLKSISLKIPKEKLVVITGPSGSGKSTLAFDTLYAECHRRYVESLSSYARQFLDIMDKPEVELIEGLSPAISIQQKKAGNNPRSTVGTITEIYDHLRLLFARIGSPHCPLCGREVSSFTTSKIINKTISLPAGTKVSILAPVIRERKGEYSSLLKMMLKQGYTRVRIDGETYRLETPPTLDKNHKHTIEIYLDRIVIKEGIKRRVSDGVELAIKLAAGLVTIENNTTRESELYNTKLGCPKCDISICDIEPRIFSFNTPHGACPTCAGLGYSEKFIPNSLIADPSLNIYEGALTPLKATGKEGWAIQQLECVAKHYKFDIKTPFDELTDKQQDILLYGSGEQKISFNLKSEHTKLKSKEPFEGIIPRLERLSQKESHRDELKKFMGKELCEECQGTRLNKTAMAVRFQNQSINDLTSQSIKQLLLFFKKLRLSQLQEEIGAPILKEITARLSFLQNVGLDYLSLSRGGNTLSGGESQRIRLATQIGSALSGVIYILDEPSIGLHPRDHSKLLKTLVQLKEMGNSILVVEHDEETINQADYIIDLGPEAGVKGGQVVAEGSPAELMNNPESLTGLYLAKKLSISTSNQIPLKAKNYLTLRNCTKHNLKNIDAAIPLRQFTCITGVSGSGKSTLIMDLLYNAVSSHLNRRREPPICVERVEGLAHIDKIIHIDQSPIGKTPRSNPATYTNIYGPIRDLFASVPESKVRGYKSGRFSFNVKGGRCEACAGDGTIKIEMHFLPDVYVKCPECQGKRYNQETLEIFYKGKNMADVLAMTVAEAYQFFSAIPTLKRRLSVLIDVGLGYLTLGQSAPTLSGGEAQRIKISKELAKRDTGNTLYILDEPTTGLHLNDIKKLIEILHSLRDKGNTLCVIEHNLHVVKNADHVIDLGPEGGKNGGTIVATGTPLEIAKCKNSLTGQYLKTFSY